MGVFVEALLLPCVGGLVSLIVFGGFFLNALSGALRRGSYFGVLAILFLLVLSIGSFAAILFLTDGGFIGGILAAGVGILFFIVAVVVAGRYVIIERGPDPPTGSMR